jgi:outer membrane protein OmpA-like peptidoglycan-associated protein
MSFKSTVVIVVCGILYWCPETDAAARALDRGSVERSAVAIENWLRALDQSHDKFGYNAYKLIVPTGAIKGYDFPIPVFRVRYEAIALFDFDSVTLRNDAVAIIRDLARKFRTDKTLANILIVGNTDSIGPDTYNYKLSLSRAVSVVDQLIEYGVEESKLTVIGLGESYPATTNATDHGRSLNRRVEFFFSTVAEAPPAVLNQQQFDPRNRNNHRLECQNSVVPQNSECGKASITQFQIYRPKLGGGLDPDGAKVSVAIPPALPVQEIEIRRPIPSDSVIRPEIR